MWHQEVDTFGLNNSSSVIIPAESNFINHLNGDNESQTNRGSLLQLAPTTGLFLTGSGASCNTWNMSQSVGFSKYSINRFNMQSTRIRTLM